MVYVYTGKKPTFQVNLSEFLPSYSVILDICWDFGVFIHTYIDRWYRS